MTLTLIVRTYCHLCDDMAAALQPLLDSLNASVEVVDIDRHPALEPAYGILVPVLLHRGTELCHYHLDSSRVRDYLTSLR